MTMILSLNNDDDDADDNDNDDRGRGSPGFGSALAPKSSASYIAPGKYHQRLFFYIHCTWANIIQDAKTDVCLWHNSVAFCS